MTGNIAQINVNPSGGVPKIRVSAARITQNGVEGDKQRNRRYHGGPERAVCLFSLERIQKLQSEGHPIEPGSTGENLTISGLDWEKLVPGTRLQSSEVTLEIASYTRPCPTIAESFDHEDYWRIFQKTHPGWSRLYARVLQEGTITEGDEIRIVELG